MNLISTDLKRVIIECQQFGLLQNGYEIGTVDSSCTENYGGCDEINDGRFNDVNKEGEGDECKEVTKESDCGGLDEATEDVGGGCDKATKDDDGGFNGVTKDLLAQTLLADAIVASTVCRNDTSVNKLSESTRTLLLSPIKHVLGRGKSLNFCLFLTGTKYLFCFY